MNAHSSSMIGIQELDIADGLKQLLMDAGFTVESVARLGYQEMSEILHIDPFVGKLIVEAAQDVIREETMAKAYHNNKLLLDSH